MTHKVLLVIFLFFHVSLICHGQKIPVELKRWLSSEEILKIKKSQELVEQGKSILFEFNKDSVFKLEDSYENLTVEFEVNKKSGRLLMDTKDYFFNGYKGQLEIYQTYIDYYLRKNKESAPKLIVDKNDAIKKMVSDAETLLKKSGAKGSVKIAGDLIHQANLKLYSAVVLSQLTMIDIQNINFSIGNKQVAKLSESEDIKTEVLSTKKDIKSSTIESSPVEPKVVSSSANVNLPEKEVLPINKKEEDKLDQSTDFQVYYTIQILADKKPISNDRLKSVYKGDLPIVLNEGGGWYRYSIGKFVDYVTAKNILQQTKVTGYIVAYNKSERIAVSKAKELLGK